jgi:hypothetical protein
MSGYSGAGAAAKIDSDIETLRRYRPLEKPDHPGRLLNQIEFFIGGQFFKIGLMDAGRDQEMAIGVREPIHQDDTEFGLPDHKALTSLKLADGAGGVA